jgi:ABC-2 type transport system permease protein
MSTHRTRWLLEKELRELAASRSYWLLLLVIGALVGHQFMTASSIYAEASGAGGGPAALSQGLSPLEGIVVPTLGAYDIAATLLFPFVVIRLIANEKQTGALALTLQSPLPFAATMTAKLVALLAAWLVAGLAGALALFTWRGAGGHLYAPETMTVVLGHLLRGLLTIGVGAAAAALATSAASAAIVALTVTLGTWALDYVAAARGGVIASVAAYTPSAALRVFEHGELRLATVLILATLGVGGVIAATVWLREGEAVSRRIRDVALVGLAIVALCVTFARVRQSRDVSEDRRNSFPSADEAALRAIHSPLRVTVYLAAEDPRLVDLERGVLAKLRRTMQEVDVTYAARGRSGLFERPDQHYGEIWYQLGDRREMTRSTTDEIVLETIYRLAGRAAPSAESERVYSGYPLTARLGAIPWLFFVAWPVCVVFAWWAGRRRGVSRRRSE